MLNAAVASALSDEEVVKRVLAGETALYEVIMRRYNQRLFRVARSIVRDPDEAEDVMQESYVNAYVHLGQFAGEAKFSTWLTRIAVHEALGRMNRKKRMVPVGDREEPGFRLDEVIPASRIRRCEHPNQRRGRCWKRQSTLCRRDTGPSS
jgi:RNA polymerase sigma-70 factor (ECF subfamily)